MPRQKKQASRPGIFLRWCVVRQILKDDLAEFGVLLAGRAAAYRCDQLHVGVEQAFAQHALADHSGSAKD